MLIDNCKKDRKTFVFFAVTPYATKWLRKNLALIHISIVFYKSIAFKEILGNLKEISDL